MGLRCPLSGTKTTYRHNLVAHLKGRAVCGGHDLESNEAESLADQAESEALGIPLSGYLSSFVGNGTHVPLAFDEGSQVEQPTGDFLKDLFFTLVANKRLPKYQFERRVDAILSLFFPGLLKARFGWDVVVVVPEFPLKCIGSNQTTNIDFALFRRQTAANTPAWLLTEIKTDEGSLRTPHAEKQIGTYLSARDRGMIALQRDLPDVVRATKKKMKYRFLQQKLSPYPSDAPIEVWYVVSAKSAAQLKAYDVNVLTYSELDALDIDSYPEAWSLFKETVLPVLA